VLRKLAKYLLAGFILISLIAFVAMTDPQELFTQLRWVGDGFIWIILISFLGYFTGSLSWKYCFSSANKISVPQLFYIRTVGELVTLFNPTNIVAGEASKYHLLKNLDYSKEEKLDSILLSRLILITSQFIIASVCCFWSAYYYEYYLFIVPGVVFILSPLLILKINTVSRILNKCKLKLIKTISIQIESINRRLSSYVVEHKKRILMSFAWATVHWLCGAVEIYIILLHLNIDPLFMHCLIVDTGVVVLKSIAGIIPGQIGAEELSSKLLLSMIGLQGATIWLTVSVLRRAKQLVWIIISALLYLTNKYLIQNKLLSNGNIVCDT